MKTRSLLLIFLFAGFIFSIQNCTCNRAESISEEELEEKTDEVLELLELDEDANTTSGDSTQTKGGDSDGAESRTNIVIQQVKESKLKTKSCDDLLQEYEDVVNEFVKTGNDEVLLKLTDWMNDPIFAACRKKGDYAAKFDALDEKMDAVE